MSGRYNEWALCTVSQRKASLDWRQERWRQQNEDIGPHSGHIGAQKHSYECRLASAHQGRTSQEPTLAINMLPWQGFAETAFLTGICQNAFFWFSISVMHFYVSIFCLPASLLGTPPFGVRRYSSHLNLGLRDKESELISERSDRMREGWECRKGKAY